LRQDAEDTNGGDDLYVVLGPRTSAPAARGGHPAALQWAREHGCRWNSWRLGPGRTTPLPSPSRHEGYENKNSTDVESPPPPGVCMRGSPVEDSTDI